MDCDPVGKGSLASAGLRVVTGLVGVGMSLTRTDGCPLLPAAGFLGAGEMSAWVCLVPKGNLPWKRNDRRLSLSLPTWAKAKANPVHRFCMQPGDVGLFGAPHRFPMTSTCVSAYFHTCSCLWRSSRAASRGRSMGPLFPLRVARSKSLWELLMTKAILNK